MNNEIIINPEFPLDETIKAHLAFYYESWGFKKLIIYAIIFSTIIGINLYSNRSPEALLLIAPLVILATAIYSHITIKKRTKDALLKNPRIKEDVTFKFNQEGFTEQGKTFEVNHLWSEYEKIKEVKNYFFLYLNKRNAIILQKEDFGNNLNGFKELMLTIPIKTDFKSA